MQLRHLGQFSVMLVVLGLGSSAFAQWVDFTNETGARLNVAASLGASDVEEKDYGIGDFDGDGDDDLAVMRKTPFTSNGPRANVLLMNEGGVLTDRTADFATASDVPGDNGFQTPTNDRDVAVVDVNGDGWLDLVTVVTLADGQPKHISHPRVYINLGSSAGCDPTAGNCDPTTWLGFEYQDARFPQLEGTAPGGQPHAPRLCSVAFADIDSDGDMDLYFGDYDSGGAQTLDFNDRMMINDGNGFFTDETTTRFVGNIIVGGGSFPFYQSAFGTSVEFADMDNDGDLDLIKDTALNAPQYVGISSNDGTGTFTSHSVLTTTTPYFVEIGDLNNDGLQDYIISSDGADNYGLNNPANPGNNFTVINFSTLGGDQGFAGNNLIYDLNNDGWNDVLICDVDIDIAGCGRRLHIYRNLCNAPNVTLQENSDTLAFSPTGVHDIALMDLNDDGWIDMVIGRCTGTQVWINEPPGGLVFSYPLGLPGQMNCDQDLTFQVEVDGFGGIVPEDGSLEFFLSTDNGPFLSQPVASLGANLYEMTLPAAPLATRYEWYVTADDSGGTTAQEPSAGAAGGYSLFVADTIEQEIDNIEGSVAAWTVETGPGLTSGGWEQATPIGTTQGGNPIAPSLDGTQGSQNTMAWVTENGNPGGSAGAADIDGGFNRLLSPVFDMSGTDGTVSFKVWYVNTETVLIEQDELVIEITNNNGATWIPLTSVGGNNPEWVAMTFQISDYTIGTDQMRVRFTADDNPNNSLAEAGVDNWIVSKFLCDIPAVTFSRGDVNSDSNFDVSDPIALLDYVFSGGTTPPCLDAADANDDGGVNIADAVMILESLFGTSGTQPAAPFPACGEDTTDDALGCDSFPACP